MHKPRVPRAKFHVSTCHTVLISHLCKDQISQLSNRTWNEVNLSCTEMHTSIHCNTSTNSCVSLKAEVSNPRFFPGEFEKIKPKSIWIICPWESSRMFPLWLQTHKMHRNSLLTNIYYPVVNSFLSYKAFMNGDEVGRLGEDGKTLYQYTSMSAA